MIRNSKDISAREARRDSSRRCSKAQCVSIVYRSFQISSRSRWDAGEFMYLAPGGGCATFTVSCAYASRVKERNQRSLKEVKTSRKKFQKIRDPRETEMASKNVILRGLIRGFFYGLCISSDMDPSLSPFVIESSIYWSHIKMFYS